MGCVQLVESLADPRLMSVVAFWVTVGALGIYVLLGKPTEFKRLTVVFCTLTVPVYVQLWCSSDGKLGGAWEKGHV